MIENYFPDKIHPFEQSQSSNIQEGIEVRSMEGKEGVFFRKPMMDFIETAPVIDHFNQRLFIKLREG